MDKILNLLSLTPGEKEAFLAAAPGLSQRFAASIPLDTADYAGTEVILGNPPPRRPVARTRSALTSTPAAPGWTPTPPPASCRRGFC